VDEREEHESETDEVAEPVTDRVRITGAEPAGEIMGLEEPEWASALPGVASAQRSLAFDEDPAEASTAPTPVVDPDTPAPVDVPVPEPAAPDLPHWTEPPTGQVPAVLDRRGDEDDPAWAGGDAGPAWREHQHEWDESGFEPALLADEETRVGALDDAAQPEHLQWEFEDLQRDTAAAATEHKVQGGHARPSWVADEWSAAEATSRLGDPPEQGERPGEGDAERQLSEPTPTGFSALSASQADPARSREFDDVDDNEPLVGTMQVGTGTVSSPFSVTSSDVPDGRTVLAAGATGAAASSGTTGAAASAAVTGAAVPGRARSRAIADARGSGAGRGPGRGAPPPSGRRNVPVAIATGVGVAVVTLVCFSLGTVATVTFAAVVVTLATAECFAALRRAGMRPATLLGLVASAAIMVAAYAKGVAAFPLVIAIVVAATMIWYLVGAERGSPVRGISGTLLAFAWIGVLGAFAGLMLSPSQYPHRHGIAFLLGAIVAVVGEDVGALLVGSWLGRHPLAPRVSPNKTWEGFFGGLVFAVVLSVVITGQVSPWTPAKAAVLGVVVAVIGPIGDLCESLVKRDLGLKDMGSMLPGHGGVLDRVDALLFVLPATYYLVRVLHLG